MKKFLALMALLLCFMVLFVACDNNNEPEPTEKPTDPIVEPAGCEHVFDNACDADCNLCGEKRAPAAHVEETVAAVAPTCTKDGLTEGKVCTVCGVVTKAQEKAPATGHTEVTVAGEAATCTKAGLTDGKVCSTCNAVVVAQEVIFATGHNAKVVEGVAATCTEDGLTSGKKCSTCNVWIQEQTVIPATGHAESTVPSVEPTCTKPGYIGATVCTVCNEVLKAEETVKALGHTQVQIQAVKATCTTPGSTAGMACSTCGEVFVEPQPTKLQKHTEKTVEGYAATCIYAGLTDGTVCEVCGVVVKAQVVIPATHGEVVDLEAVAPTCTTLGYTLGKACADCGAVIVPQEILPYQHEYAFECDVDCDICGYVRSLEPMHVWGFTSNGTIGCVYECGAFYEDSGISPKSYVAGSLLESTRVNDPLWSSAPNYSFGADYEYLRITGKTETGDGSDRAYGFWMTGTRYTVLRYRTSELGMMTQLITTGNSLTHVVADWGSTTTDWQIIVIDNEANGQIADGIALSFRVNIGATADDAYTDISHVASFTTFEDAMTYANQVGEIVDGHCPHLAYVPGWNGTPICTHCYEVLTPTTSHVGGEIYHAIDPTSLDFDLVTNNGSQGVTVTGAKTYNYGAPYDAIPAAELILKSDVDFGKYMVVVYKMDTATAFLGISANGGIASYAEVAQTPDKWAVCNYGTTRVEAGTSLAVICNFAGASNSVGIQAIYTFDSVVAATAYAEMLEKQCFHDVTTTNELNQTVCDNCYAIQGATPEWPLDLESGWVTTPEFIPGTSMMDPGVQRYYYSYIAEDDVVLVVDAGDTVSIIVNGYYVDSPVALNAGDKVEVIVEAEMDYETWTALADPAFFIVDIAHPGSQNNPFELVLGENTTPEFVEGKGFMDPNAKERYFYKWVATGNGKLTLAGAEGICWTVNGNWGEGLVVEVVKGDVVEITVDAPRDEETWMLITTPVTFSAEFDLKHEFSVDETGAIVCNKGCHEALVPTTYTSGSDIYYRAFELQTTVSGVTFTTHDVTDNTDYVTVTGAVDGANALSKILSVAQGGNYEGGTPIIQRYLVMRLRTAEAMNFMYVVTYNQAMPWAGPIDIATASHGEWTTLVIDLGADTTPGHRIDIAINVASAEGATTDISHIASFTTVEAAQAYAGALGQLLDGVCSHNIETGWEGSAPGAVRCTMCGLESTPVTYQAGAGLYGVVDPESQDYALVVNGGDAGISVNGTGTHAYGTGANLKLANATNFGQYMVVVYTVDANSFLGVSVDDNIASYVELPAASGLTICNYGATQASGNTLDIICNFGGASSSTGIYGVVTFGTAQEAELFAQYLQGVTGWPRVK